MSDIKPFEALEWRVFHGAQSFDDETDPLVCYGVKASRLIWVGEREIPLVPPYQIAVVADGNGVCAYIETKDHNKFDIGREFIIRNQDRGEAEIEKVVADLRSGHMDHYTIFSDV